MIERTLDYRIVNRLSGDWNPIISDECFYLLEKNIGEILGMWSFHPHKEGVMIHADMGLKCRGKKAIESAKSAFEWVFRNTEFKKIYASIPDKNRPACRVASFAGMRFSGNAKQFRNFELKVG